MTIPIHPQPGIYETTVITTTDGAAYTHTDYERFASEPPWSIEGAKDRAVGAMLDKGWEAVPSVLGGVLKDKILMAPTKKKAPARARKRP